MQVRKKEKIAEEKPAVGKVVPSPEAVREFLKEQEFPAKGLQPVPPGIGGVPGAMVAPEKPTVEEKKKEEK